MKNKKKKKDFLIKQVLSLSNIILYWNLSYLSKLLLNTITIFAFIISYHLVVSNFYDAFSKHSCTWNTEYTIPEKQSKTLT